VIFHRTAAAALALIAATLAGQGEVSAEGAGADPAQSERVLREQTLRDIESELQRSAESRRRLADEIAAIKADGARLSAALIEAGARARATEDRIREAEDRLGALTASETAIRGSLETRRDSIGEVLAALQRVGSRRPPAVLARPGDIVSAVRAAILLGELTPALRGEAESLAADLAELVRLKDLAAAEKLTLSSELSGLASDQERLNALLDARRGRLARSEGALAGDRARAETLAQEARTLRDLVERLAPRSPPSTDPPPIDSAEALRLKDRFATAALREATPLSPRTPFADARGQLPRPAGGPVLRRFGEPDALGAAGRGIAIATRPMAVVTASADGWVAYAGPFRSFGRLLILNVGGGYNLVLAGLDRLSVDIGQFVLAGEPIGQMGGSAAASAALAAVETTGPVLYVELRKDGSPIDPAPWWAKSQNEKVRG
jgi:septal ring factor EnvC (AmiA/AmiB activator)